MRCPRCKSLCTPQELAASQPVSYVKSQHVVVTDAGQFIPASVADTLAIDGREAWTRREVERKVCDACVDEIRRGGKAHSSTVASGAWRKRG